MGIQLYNVTEVTWDMDTRNLRDDLALFSYAVEQGFMAKTNSRIVAGVPQDSLSFHKGNKIIWQSRLGWRCADIVDGYYENHRTHITLKEALDFEA